MDLIFKDDANARIFTAVHNNHVLGYVAIDSTIHGRSCGGLRMLPDIDEAEIQALARTMTLKYGFLGLPQGGAKAGVIGNPEAPEPERLKRLVEFGHAIEPLLRTKTFVPNADMGTHSADIRYMLNAVGIRVGRRELQEDSSGFYTAHSVLAAVVQSARHMGLNLSNALLRSRVLATWVDHLLIFWIVRGLKLSQSPPPEGGFTIHEGSRWIGSSDWPKKLEVKSWRSTAKGNSLNMRLSSNYPLIYSVPVPVGIAFTPVMQRAFRHASSALVQIIQSRPTQSAHCLNEERFVCQIL